jgi:hypothetical protein
LEDIKEIRALTVGVKDVVDFAYRSPFREHGEGIVTYFAGVPRLTQEYLRDKGPVTNSMTEHVVSEEVGAYVIDKNYFADVAAVKSAANVDLLGPKPVRVEADDRLIELRTVFLLIRK